MVFNNSILAFAYLRLSKEEAQAEVREEEPRTERAEYTKKEEKSFPTDTGDLLLLALAALLLQGERQDNELLFALLILLLLPT